MNTPLPSVADLPKKATWFCIDAKGVILGKVAEKAARILLGKDRPDYTPHMDLGDGVIIINAKEVAVTGRKLHEKIYRRHSGYRGNLKEVTLEKMLEKKPTEVIRLAVSGMLSKNKLRASRLTRLKIYPGSEHPHAPQQPTIITL